MDSLDEIHEICKKIQKAPIVPHSFYILGAGQFGRTAIKYALSQANFPNILVIDKEFDSTNELLHDFFKVKKYYQVLFTKSLKKIFLESDISTISEMLKHGFPDYLIPAVPIHAVAYIITHLISFLKSKINKNDPYFMEKWDQLLKSLPQDVILKSDSKNGVILLSWAKIDEICPSDCPAPLDFCPHHQRKKSETITEISKAIHIPEMLNLTIESHQVQPGLGLIRGSELKNILLKALNYIIERNKTNSRAFFFISTTCACHGALNLFTLNSK